jgi:NAD(P)-dependent dehydrogenase (short-subunit alcohol dehydrogenase family)
MSDTDVVLPSMRLDGRVALVTGAGRGIGSGCALALAEAGAEVIAMSRTPSEIAAVADAIRARGGRARAVVCDVTDTSAMQRHFAALDRLDILVNNAGTSIPEPFLSVEPASLERMLALNCGAAVLVAQAAARIMERQGSGVIINLSSTYGKNGRPGSSVYSATKHFIEGLTKSIAVELAPRGVRVVAVGPTAIETPLTRDRLNDPAVGADLLSRIPMGRFGQVADVVGAVVFLASPAAALITGTTLMVDGGWTAQ